MRKHSPAKPTSAAKEINEREQRASVGKEEAGDGALIGQQRALPRGQTYPKVQGADLTGPFEHQMVPDDPRVP